MDPTTLQSSGGLLVNPGLRHESVATRDQRHISRPPPSKTGRASCTRPRVRYRHTVHAFRAAGPRSVTEVSPEPPAESKARLFVALDLPQKVRAGIGAWQAKALGDPALRPMPAESLHITLCFLASRPERDIARIEAVLGAIKPRQVDLRFEPEPLAVPKGRPRLYMLSAESNSAVALQAELAEALAAERLYNPEERRFRPHVTVARVRSERLPPERGQRRGKARPKRVRKRPGPLPSALEQPFDAVRVVLYRSNLKPQGAEYLALSGVDLPSPRT